MRLFSSIHPATRVLVSSLLRMLAVCTAFAATPALSQEQPCIVLTDRIEMCGLNRSWFATPAANGALIVFTNPDTRALAQIYVAPGDAETVAGIYRPGTGALSDFAEIDQIDGAGSRSTYSFAMTSRVEMMVSPAIVTWIDAVPDDPLVIETGFPNVYLHADREVLLDEQRASHAELVTAVTERTQ